MRVACVGGGPAGLYFSILMKRSDPDHDITVFERNPAGSTYGWGVTYWSDLLDTLRAGDEPSARAISENSVRWSDGVAHIRGEVTTHRGDEGFSIGRQRLLDILAERATELGVRIEYGREIESLDQLPDAELVVAGDGINSRLRRNRAEHFGTETATGRNRFIWLGTSKTFGSFTFAFVESDHGWIWCYAYRFSGDLSTFIVECSPETWAGLGFDTLGEDGTTALLEQLFARQLDGHPLISRPDGGAAASWLSFGTMTNRRWYHDNLVLLGDAAHTTHYSIGAGTKLALEDAVGLAAALRRHGELPSALAAGIAATATLVEVDLAVIGGGVAQAGDILFTPLRRHLARYATLSFASGITVVPAALGTDAGLVGAAALAAARLGPDAKVPA